MSVMKIEGIKLTKCDDTQDCLIESGSIEVEEGSVVLLLGENGAGKSTLVKTVRGFGSAKLIGTKVFFGGRANDYTYISRATGYAAQDDKAEFYINGLSYVKAMAKNFIRENGEDPYAESVKNAKMLFTYFANAKTLFEKFHNGENLFEKFLNEKDRTSFSNSILEKGKFTNRLSGGQWKLLTIIAALSLDEAPLYFLDEPLNNLDSNTIRALLDLIRYMKEHYKSSFLIITHCRLFKDPERVYQLSDCHIDDVTDQYKSYDCLDSIKGGCTKCL